MWSYRIVGQDTSLPKSVTVTEEEPEPKLKFTVPPEEAPVAGVADVATLATASTLAVSTVLGTRPFSS
jgi:hypothetical protein